MAAGSEHPDHGRPSRRLSCGRFVIPLFAAVILLFSISRFLAGDAQTGIIMAATAFLILFLIPVGYLARLLFRGPFWDLIRGDDVEHPVVSTRRFRFSLIEHKRPFWVTAALFILAWIVGLLAIGLAMR